MKTIELGHNYRLRRLDALNWELEQFRVPVQNHRAKGTEPKWIRTGRYYQTLGGAFAAVYELILKDGDDAADLREALDRAECIKDELKAVKTKLADIA